MVQIHHISILAPLAVGVIALACTTIIHLLLGCFALRRETKSYQPDGSVFQVVIWQAVYVTEGDVSKYFKIPASYREMAPSEVATEMNRKYPDIPSETKELFDKADANYRKAQSLMEHHVEELPATK